MENENLKNSGKDNNTEQMQTEIQKILYQIEVLKKQAESIETQVGILNEIIKQTNVYIESIGGLKELTDKESKKEKMFSMGGKIFIKMQILSNNALYHIGRKIFIEKSYEDIEKSLRNEVVKFTKTLDELNKKRSEIYNVIEQLNISGQKIAAKLQQE